MLVAVVEADEERMRFVMWELRRVLRGWEMMGINVSRREVSYNDV